MKKSLITCLAIFLFIISPFTFANPCFSIKTTSNTQTFGATHEIFNRCEITAEVQVTCDGGRSQKRTLLPCANSNMLCPFNEGIKVEPISYRGDSNSFCTRRN